MYRLLWLTSTFLGTHLPNLSAQKWTWHFSCKTSPHCCITQSLRCNGKKLPSSGLSYSQQYLPAQDRPQDWRFACLQAHSCDLNWFHVLKFHKLKLHIKTSHLFFNHMYYNFWSVSHSPSDLILDLCEVRCADKIKHSFNKTHRGAQGL